MNEVAVDTEHSPDTVPCKVVNIKPLSRSAIEVELQSVIGVPLDYYAGQYLQLDLDLNHDGQLTSLFYSIANSFDPDHPSRLLLIIENNTELTHQVCDQLSKIYHSRGNIQVTMPMGQAYLQTDPNALHLLVAAGSGISQIKCLTEAILKQKSEAELHVYWSNRHAHDFYLMDEYRQWSNQNPKLSFTPILEAAHANWRGRSGYLYEVIQDDFDSLNDYQVYLCGSPKMVYGTIDQLKTRGLSEKNCYSDVFEYAPRC